MSKNMLDLAVEFNRSRDFQRLRDKTKANYSKYIVMVLNIIGSIPVADITRRDVELVIGGYSATPGQANNVLAVMRRLMGFAIYQGDTTINPCQNVRPEKLGEYKRWPTELLDSFLENCKNPLVYTATLVAYETGMRLTDVSKHNWDWDATFRVAANREQHEYGNVSITYAPSKTGGALTVPISKKLAKHLVSIQFDCNHLMERPDGAMFPVKPKLLSNAFGRERDRQGILGHANGGYCFHGLRKSAAARLAEAGCTTREIMSITGHRSLREVERYTLEAEQTRLAQSAMVKLEAA